MSNKYFQVTDSVYTKNKYYIVTYLPDFYKTLSDTVSCISFPFSYQWVQIQLFGLTPKYFFTYIAERYHAIIQHEKDSIWHVIYFTNAADALAYCNECERRFAFCVERGDFNGNQNNSI